MRRVWIVAFALVLAWANGARAQIASGNIYGTATDQQGGVLPGATITLTPTSIGGQPRTSVTDASGQFRFLNLDAGSYKVAIEMSGFTRQERDVIVTTGINTTVAFTLSVGALETAVNVTAEAPVIDFKKIGTATTLSREELQSTPQSKDPWAMLKTVPGVVVDRVNVGGNESGQQSGFIGKGALFADTMWNLDGVAITDTTSGGASSSYFDFDAFDEVAVNTGGNDLKVQTGGVGINFVTRRGTNQFKGYFKYTWDGNALESSNLPSELVGDTRLRGADKANHTDRIYDVGFDIGGPIVKDKLWFWGSYGRNDIGIVRLNQTGDRTILKNTNAKINWAATDNDQVSGFYFNGAKEKLGRSPGQAATEDDSFLWNQGNFYPQDGFLHPLHGLWKIEDNHVFGPNLFVNAKYAWYGWGYGFAPRGGTGQDAGIDFVNDHAYGSWTTYTARKPWHIVDVSGSSFKATKSTNHEFKFGFGYRRSPNHSTTRWSGNEVVAHINTNGQNTALAYRARVVNYTGETWDAFVGDTITAGRLTVNGGIRWDRQTAANSPSTAPANTMFPDLLPALSYDGSGPTIKWNDISPRIGATYALGESKKTVARASYARYAGQLNPFEVTSASPVGAYYTFIAYKWVDLNRDGFAQRNEILTNQGPQYSNAINPANPTSVTSVNTIDSKYKANHDHEFIVGADHEIMPNLSVGAAYTFRRTNDWVSWNPRIGLTAADYTINDTETSRGSTVVAYAPNNAKVDATGGGRILTNRPDYHSTFSGVELNLIKRLSNRWMARVAVSFNNWQEHFDGSAAVQNPTRTDSITLPCCSTGTASGPQVDGGQIAPRSGGSGKGDIFYNARWQINANGFYQLPQGFEVGANIFGRQGYIEPLIIAADAGADGTVRVLATQQFDQNRYDNLWDIDLRVAKTIDVSKVKILLSADLFNALNSNTVLARTRNLGSSAFGAANDIISPRIMRVGLKVQF
jgi:Carboxypeptidase regulatory-like domain/TonB-dependent Receptor Plug Domain